ncbi:hypothetical protein ACFL27_22315 [candidate division CSSED10-310 bacterium]|uniref:DUF4124 domain-containing protein n=1 Tax=candidate division CSSED10-310 bacterium TaxID=2855610 RepID=A0ABV6Z3N0_UNCC1
MNTVKLFSLVLLSIFCVPLLIIQPTEAEVFVWVDDQGVTQYANIPPLWWQTDKLIFAKKRIVDKVATLKKLDLPLDTADFNSDDIVWNYHDPRTPQKTAPRSSTGSHSARAEPEISGGYVPKSYDDLLELKRGSVIGNASNREFHTPDCMRIKVTSVDKPRYRVPLQKMIIFDSPQAAEQNGYKRCSRCRGKPH